MPESTAANNDNGKVTLALLGQKVDNQTNLLSEFITETKAYRAGFDQRLRDIERNNAIEAEKLKATQMDVECDHTELEQIKTKVNLLGGINATLATIGSLLAAWVGINK